MQLKGCTCGLDACSASSCIVLYPGRYWEMVQRLKITHFYTAPTAIRMLIRKGDDWVKKYDRSSLRILGCGEHSNTCTCTCMYIQ